MLIISLAFSLFFLVGAWAAYPSGVRSGGRLTTFLVCGFLAVVFSLAVSPQLLATAIVLIIAGIACRGLKVCPSRFAWTALTGTLFVYAGFALGQLPSFLKRQRIRERYPIESLSARLEYEQQSLARRAPPTDSATESPAEVADSAAATQPIFAPRLDALESSLTRREWPSRSRSEALRIIHSSYVEQFIDSPGFGLERMPRMRAPELYADLPAPKVFTLPPAECIDLDGTLSGAATTDGRPPSDPPPVSPPPAPRQLETLHEDGLVDFINSRGWGLVRNRDNVAGFQPHQFRRPPVLPAADAVAQKPYQDSGWRNTWEDSDRAPAAREPDQNWEVRKLQLVSLLKHDEPSVYVTDELPRMDRLAEVPVRPLDAFEQPSLRALERGEDVASDSTDANRIRMLGAIRAAKQCLKCHSVERGELLGAFSYMLERTMPVREPHKPLGPTF